MIATIKSVKAALDQISNYFDKEIYDIRSVSLWDGLSVQVSNIARRDSNKNIPVTENGLVDPEVVFEEIDKVIDSMSTDYHGYMG